MQLDMALEGIAEMCDALESALDDEMGAWIDRTADAVARFAKSDHDYTNRTGNLQANTISVRHSGSFGAGTLQAAAVGNMPYGSFVEDGTSRSRAYPFLGPAWQAIEPVAAQDADNALAKAAKKAGW